MSALPIGEQARRLPPVAQEMLESIYLHRLLSAGQLHALHNPEAKIGWTRRVLRQLEDRRLVDRVPGPRTRSHWIITDHGADAVETASPGVGRRYVPSRAQAEGPLRAHTLAVNDVGVAFAGAARQRGDECGPLSWRHEVAHQISPHRGRRPGEFVIADALLTYIQSAADGAFALHQRWIELDRGTARPADALAEKLTRYTQLRHYTPTGETQPAWRGTYRAFPQLLVVLAGQSPERARQRIGRTIALYNSDPTRQRLGAIPASFVTLDDLTTQGPFAQIFIPAGQPEQLVDWLGK
jgi:hypothetical protein